ncbi:MAG TPA: hypothetical protein GXZ48_03110 [Acholeplasmataceae bacterium]|nr:hypothetical protein [Acholeplasmataceae bacterium]
MKIFLMIIGLLMFFQINIHGQEITEDADPLIVSVGIGDEKILQLDNCKLISNNVEWGKIGLYEATYFNETTQKYFSRKIRITSFDELNEGLGIYESISYDIEDNLTIYNTFLYDENSYFIFGSLPSNDEPKQTIYPQEFAFIHFYNNGKLEWKKVYDKSYSFVSSLAKTNMGIVILLSYEENNQTEMKLVELNIHGEVLRELKISTPGIEQGYDIYFDGTKIYIVCTSDSTNGDIKYSFDETQYISLIKVNYESFDLESYKCYGNKGYNILKKTLFYNDTFYILFQATGNEGRHQNDSGGYRGYFLVRINPSFDYENINYISINDHIDDFFITNHCIVFVSREYVNQYSYLKFYVNNHELLYSNIYYWKYPQEGVQIKKVRSVNNYLGDVLLAIDTKEEMFSGLLSVYDFNSYGFAEFNDEKFQTINALFDNEKLVILGINDNKFYKTTGYLIETETINSYQVVNKDYLVRKLIINNFPISYIGNTKDKVPFGYHKDILSINFGSVKLYLLDEYYVYEKINIKDGEIYDTGIEISFNGIGYLNDEKCESPLEINLPGEYCLIIYGNSGERKVINFSVKNLSLVPKYQEKEIPTINGIELINQNNQISKELNFENLITNPKSYQLEAIIFAIINTVFILISFFIWRKK